MIKKIIISGEMMKNRILFFSILLLSATLTFSQNYIRSTTPQRIILNLTSSPESSIAVTWRTNGEVNNPQVKYSLSTDWREIDSNFISISANTEKVKLDSDNYVYHHSAILKNLQADKIYSYKVGCKHDWSEWNQFTTADNSNSEFEFVFFGDPQVDVREYVSRIFRKAFITAPKAKFWLFIGDLMDKPLDHYWDELFYAGGFIFSMVPSVMVPGSHEYAYKLSDGTRINQFTPLWYAHFTLPENGIKSMEEKSYYFDYNGVRFIMLDTQSKLNEQAKWLDSLLSNTQSLWKIVAFHEPVYSMGRGRDQMDSRNAFMSIIEKHNVDLVLSGHDHVYARSHKLKNGGIDQQNGTVYIISQCGGKTYTLNTKYSELMAKTATNIQLFQKILINNSRLLYNSYTVNGELFDSFELLK